MDLRGRNVLVTGASRGIGEAVAKRFVAAGAHVIGVARNVELLAKVMADIGGAAVPTDLADPTQVDGLVARIEKDHGPIDILVNNAGLDMAGALVDTKPEDIRAIHQVNLVTPIELCRQVLPGMLVRGRGHIVNVSSLAGVGGFAGMTSYCSAKGGLTNFTGVLRLELKGTPIGITLAELGPIPTDMLEHVNDFAPTRRSFDRFYKLQMLVDVPREQVAEEIAIAVEKGKRHVRIPKRAMAFPLLNEAPRRIIETLLVGVRSRP
jgi:NAD(P)-dependent dehydrogenase (short-subunit alcohol dehydrogenase family)